MMADHCLSQATVNQFWQHTEHFSGKKSQHILIFRTNAFVVIKATQGIFELQKIIVDTIKIKSHFYPTLVPKMYHLLHYCVQRNTERTKYQLLKHSNKAYRYNQEYRVQAQSSILRRKHYFLFSDLGESNHSWEACVPKWDCSI